MGVDSKLETGESLRRDYIKALHGAKRRYDDILKKKIEEAGKLHQEGWDYYKSGLTGTVDSYGRQTGYFDSNANYTFHGLPDFSDGIFTGESIVEACEEFRVANPDKKIMMLDAMGQGTVGVGIADEVVATSLIPVTNAPKEVTYFTGDALGDTVTKEVLTHLDRRAGEKFSLRFAFFRPVAGLEDYDRNLYVLHTLYQRLRDVYELMGEGGICFLQSTGPGSDIEFISKILSDPKFADTVRVDNPPRDRLALRKIKGLELPSIEDILDTHPEIVRSLLRMEEADKRYRI